MKALFATILAEWAECSKKILGGHWSGKGQLLVDNDTDWRRSNEVTIAQRKELELQCVLEMNRIYIAV